MVSFTFTLGQAPEISFFKLHRISAEHTSRYPQNPDALESLPIWPRGLFSILQLTPTSAVAESDGFLCDNERQRMTQKNDAFGNPLDVLVS